MQAQGCEVRPEVGSPICCGRGPGKDFSLCCLRPKARLQFALHCVAVPAHQNTHKVKSFVTSILYFTGLALREAMISADTLDTNLVARQSSLFLCCCLCVWGGSGLVSVWTCSGIGFSVTNGGPFRALLTLPPSCHVHSVSQVPPCDWLIWTSVPNQTVQCPYWSVPCAPFFVDQTSPPVAAETRVESSPPPLFTSH